MRMFRSLLVGCVALVAAMTATFAAAPGNLLAVAPVMTAAARVSYAGQAMMLGVAHAGPRLVAVGDHGIVLLSDDGGRTHRQAAAVPVDVTLTSVSFADNLHGWAVGQWGVILHTEDGGETWTLQRKDTQSDRPLFAVRFFDARNGVAVGLWSLVLVTDDGGARWSPVDMPVPEGAKHADLNLFGLFVDGHERIFAPAEKGMVLRSEDRGRHWAYLATGYKGSFWTGLATPDGVLLAAGLRGSLYRSTDDGASWQRVDTRSTSSITALAQAGARVFGVGLDGLQLRSDDSGMTFQSSVRQDRLPLTAVAAMRDGSVALYSKQGVVPAGGDDSGK